MALTDEHLELLAVSNADRSATIRQVENNADTIFTWDYNKGARPALTKLYEKAKHSQWDGETDLDWSIDVDQEALAGQSALQLLTAAEELTRPLPAHRPDLVNSSQLVVDLCDLIREARDLGC